MTSHPIDTEALRFTAEATVKEFGPAAWPDIPSSDLVSLLDLLADAKRRATRAEAQSEARRINTAYWKEQARIMTAKRDAGVRLVADVMKERNNALTRIKAVEDVMDDHVANDRHPYALPTWIRRALDGSVTPPAA